jgi:hypothetical protein
MSEASTDVTKLRLEVESSKVREAVHNLDDLVKSGKSAEKTSMGMVAAWTLTATAIGLAGTAIGVAAHKFYEASKASTKLKSDLAGVGISSDKMAGTFSDLLMISEDFKGGVETLTDAFTALRAHGLDATEEALRKYQDHAAHYGRSLQEYAQAVVNTTVGEMEALKKFGITVQRDNDKMVMSFMGQKTVIEGTVKSLETYLQKIAESNFLGASAARENNIGDVIAKIGQEFDKFFVILASQSGSDNILLKWFTDAKEGAESLNHFLASGELEARLHALVLTFEPLADGAKAVLTAITDMFIVETALWEDEATGAVDNITTSWSDLPVGAQAAVKRIVENFSDMLLRIKYIAKAFTQTWSIELDAVKQKARIAAQAIADAFKDPLNSAKHFDAAGKALDAVDAEKAAKSKAVDEDFVLRMNAMDKIHAQAHKNISDERNSAIKSIDDQYEKADKLRKEHEEKRKSGGALPGYGSTDRKVQFQGAGGSGRKGGGGRGGEDHELEMLVASLRTQEEEVRASYEERLEIIDKYTQDGSAMELELGSRLVEQTAEELAHIRMMRDGDYGSYFQSLKEAEVLLYDSYQERRRIILENTAITENERAALMTQAESSYTNAQRRMEMQRQRTMLKGASDFFGNLAAIGSAFGSKGFKIAKAAAIAQATIKTYESATSAYASLAGIPYIGPFLGAAAAAAAIAAGAANIASIKSQSYQAYEHGGMIPSGKVGLVGEAGGEFVKGPAVVTSARTSKGYLEKDTPSKAVVVQIFNLPGQTATVQETTNPNGEAQLKVIIQRVEDKLTADVRTGGGTFAPTMARTFGLRRTTA